ncbi:fibronectin type III domain-containing protein [Nonomuraea rhizosphaerae]|uniref:fibronectin type III domain-containing protein n=1 Tax=Nonomuraea rhizosphaerae TaxID=2665663 RepID=UPI001C5DD5D9|nr:fibronectin type III domain-containing protein [Nonomuraea rhizosphaerae]
MRSMLRGDRATALVAAGVAAVLVAAAAVFGVGVSSANPKLADVGAWLWTKVSGKIVHVNGLSGEVDGYLNSKSAKRLRVVQDAGNVLLVDDSSGYVSRIEPSQLSVAQTKNFGAAGLQIVVSGAAGYAVDPAGKVQQIDPATLNSVGAPLTLEGPLGSARIDGGGQLWVPVTAKGEVVPVARGVAASPVKVGEPGEELAVTIAGGLPVIVNTRAATASIVGADGGVGEITLPKEVAQAAKGGLLAPALTEGSLVPLLTPGDSGLLVVVDTASNSVLNTKVAVEDPAALGVPQVLGSKVYVPDSSTGGLIVWDSAAGGRPTRLQVADSPGPLDVFVKDGLLWANDENGDKAVVIDTEGRKHDVQKDDSDVPGPTNTPQPKQTPRPDPTNTDTRPDPTRTADPRPTDTEAPEPDPLPTTRRPTRSQTPTPTRTPTPTATPTKSPTPTPTPTPPTKPGSVSAKSGPGHVSVNFSPSTGGKVERYTLKVSGGDGRSTPQSVDADGPFQFEFSGGNCSGEYTFTVVAHWSGGEVASEPSAGVKPCVAPGKPANFQAKGKNRGAELTWDAPEGGADGITYVLSGAASDNSVTGTKFTAEGLKNNQKHEFKLQAKNDAGESPDVATASVDLAYPRQQYQNVSNNDSDTLIRPGPSGSGESGRIKQGQYITVTVICQVKGSNYTDPSTGGSSDVWNRIESPSGNGYLNDTLVGTPKGGFPAAPLFECTD